MKFQIVLSNHHDKSMNWLEDVTCWLWRGLEEAGHVAGVSVDEIDLGAINIFFEYFPNRTLPVFKKLARHRIPFGIVCTEAITGDTFNNYDRADDMIIESEGFNWKKRLANFRTVAGVADFVWCLEPDSVIQAKTFTKGKRAVFLQSGYVAGRRETKPRPLEHKNIDILFFGEATPYRKRILDQLRAASLKVEAPAYFVPAFARTSLIERSKICLSLNKRENWPIPSVGRIGYLINNGALVVWEEPPYKTGHEPYSLAVAIDAIVETCAAVIGDYDPGLGERNALAYQRDLPMSKILRRAVAETCGHLK